MASKKTQIVRKPSKKIADSRRVRYGSGNAPRVVRAHDAATQDQTMSVDSGLPEDVPRP